MSRTIYVTTAGLSLLAAVLYHGVMNPKPVSAQSSRTVYVDRVVINASKPHDEVQISGTQVLGFSCSDGTCSVLSR